MTSDDLMISGLLVRRDDIIAEIVHEQSLIAALDQSMEKLDAELFANGFEDDLEGRISRRARVRRFGQYEFENILLELLKLAQEPMTPRELAKAISHVDGSRRDDREFLIYFTLRTRQCLVRLRKKGLVEILVPEYGTARWRPASHDVALPYIPSGQSFSRSRSMQTGLFSAKGYRS
jgi:hypothetical protein